MLMFTGSYVCLGQTKSDGDCSLHQVKDGIPSLGALRTQIERHPVFSIEVDGSGRVRNVHVVKGTGTPKVDRKLSKAIARWQYKPQPSCPTRETTVTLTIEY
jgi:TonB family protein